MKSSGIFFVNCYDNEFPFCSFESYEVASFWLAGANEIYRRRMTRRIEFDSMLQQVEVELQSEDELVCEIYTVGIEWVQ